MKYEWVELRPYPGYMFCADGRVRDKHKNLCATHITRDGTDNVRIKVNGAWEWLPRDVLTAIAFMGPPPNRWYRVDHINGDVSDCHADNLTWTEDAFGFYDRLMRDDGGRVRRRSADKFGDHGRAKVANACRRHHPLSVTGEPDENTAVWSYGNRICRRCWPEELTDIVRRPNCGAGRW